MDKGNSWAHRFDRHGPQLLIAGPCVIESETHAMRMAEVIRDVTEAFEGKFLWTFKASFDKANRTSNSSPRGVGIGEGDDDGFDRALALILRDKRGLGPNGSEVNRDEGVEEVAGKPSNKESVVTTLGGMDGYGEGR